MIQACARGLLRTWSRIGKAPGWQYRLLRAHGARLAAARPLKSKLPTGQTVWCDLTDHIERCIYFFGIYEPVESIIFCRLLSPGMTVIDVGAFVGQYSLLAANEVGPTGHVHSFEPVPRNFERVSAHVLINDLQNVTVQRVALWNRRCDVNLGVPTDVRDDAGLFTIGAPGAAISCVAPAARLDDYVRNHDIKRVDVIKIDVEGAEPFVFEGARELLARDHPTIMAEVNREALERLGTTVEQYWAGLASLGYSAAQITGSPQALKPLADLRNVVLANVLFHAGPLHPALLQPVDVKGALRWARRGWRFHGKPVFRSVPTEI